MQQIAGAAEPAKERGQGEAVERGHLAASLRVRVGMDVGVPNVQVAKVESTEAAEGGEHAEHKSEHETDEVKRDHQDAFFLRDD